MDTYNRKKSTQAYYRGIPKDIMEAHRIERLKEEQELEREEEAL